MENLMYAPKNGFDRLSAEERAEMNAYCRRYMDFMDKAKTEREAVTETIRIAESNGFKEFKYGMDLKPGDKLLYVPGHCCTTINTFDKVFVAENGEVVDCWDITSRGKAW